MPGDAPRLHVRARVEGDAGRGPRLDVDLAIADRLTAIVGPSGAGKTTLLECIAGLIRPSAGRIVLGDTPVFDDATGTFVAPHRRRVGLVFQSLALFPHLSALENVAFGVRGARRHRLEGARAWLSRVRAAGLADRMAATLSGGEAQRVALARALAAEPRVLLLDEPFSALNVELRLELGDVLREVLGAVGVQALLVTHDLEDARRLGERVLALDGGRLVGDARR